MNLQDLPLDILEIIYDICDLNSLTKLSETNKIFYNDMKTIIHIRKIEIDAKKRLESKTLFLNLCGFNTDERWLMTSFDRVFNIEQCQFLHEEYIKKYKDDFNKRVHYVINNTYRQLTIDSWNSFLNESYNGILIKALK